MDFDSGSLLPLEVFVNYPSFRIHQKIDLDYKPLFNVFQLHLVKTLIITEREIVETIHNPLLGVSALVTVVESESLGELSKLKFKRDHTGPLSLHFKNGKILLYNINKMSECVTILRERMLGFGMEGKDVTKRKIGEELSAQASQLMNEFSRQPNIGMVENIMDVLRQAIEKSSEDGNFSDTVELLQLFLKSQEVLDVLDAQKAMGPALEKKKTAEFDLDEETQLSSSEKDLLREFDASMVSPDASEESFSLLEGELASMNDEFNSLMASMDSFEKNDV